VPLSFLGARNIMHGTLLGQTIYVIVRTIFNLGRAIEVLILAVIMAVVVGIGPFAGMMAIVLHSIGAMGKLYSEAIESIDPGPIEAITATGANRLQTVLFAVVPQVIPQFLSFTMYRWDINVRMSTVVGLVGGGGIGFLLIQYINLLQWSQAATALWLIAIVVTVMDYASAAIRARLI
jgi:phosphonate transport system permease protein